MSNNNQEPLAIVIVAYNRAKALSNLLQSISKIKTDCNIPLVISIDGGGTAEVNKIADEYVWRHGKKRVVIHEKLGLVKHFIWAGDQSEKFGNVLFLEDDLSVSSDIINYAQQLISFYKDDDRITGGSCYNMMYTLSGMHFYQIQDGYDNFFWQHPYWGNIWFGKQWKEFKRYLDTYEVKNELLPRTVQPWIRSFKKIYLQFLAETNKTMVFPRVSLVTNNGIGGGDHNKADAVQFHVPFLVTLGKKYQFSHYDESLARYDLFEEIDVDVVKSLCKPLSDFDFVIDTKLNRSFYGKDYVLTTLKTSKSIIQFDSNMKPTELSTLLDISGAGLSLTHINDIDSKTRNAVMYDDCKKNIYRPVLRISWQLFIEAVKQVIYNRMKKYTFLPFNKARQS